MYILLTLLTTHTHCSDSFKASMHTHIHTHGQSLSKPRSHSHFMVNTNLPAQLASLHTTFFSQSTRQITADTNLCTYKSSQLCQHLPVTSFLPLPFHLPPQLYLGTTDANIQLMGL